ncbi:MAG TPA: type II toxin-antitoxin system VapC family toxin [Gemmatimonadales bacterium]
MKVCPDTTCWIARLIDTDRWRASYEGERGRVEFLLTSVVLQELWMGAGTLDRRAYAERIYDAARRHRRFLNPPAVAWILSGQALQILTRRRQFGAARLRALRNDVLLAATAYLYGAAVMTHDAADFAAIAEVLPVRVVGPP